MNKKEFIQILYRNYMVFHSFERLRTPFPVLSKLASFYHLNFILESKKLEFCNIFIRFEISKVNVSFFHAIVQD